MITEVMPEEEYIKGQDLAEAMKKVVNKRKGVITERPNNPVFLTRESFKTGKIEAYNPIKKQWVPEAMKNDSYLISEMEAQMIIKQDEMVNGKDMFYDLIPYGYRESIEEADVNVDKLIKDLAGNFSGSNEEQMKAVQLLKGLATSDNPKSNEFMKALDKATTEISNKMSGSTKESIEEKEKWSADVKTKWKAPEGTFTKSASEIASIVLKGHKGDAGSAIKAINFYLNRAGKDISNRGEVEKAMGILQKKNESIIILNRDHYLEGRIIPKGTILKEVK